MLRLIGFLLFVIAGACLSSGIVFAEPIPFSLKRGVPEIEVTINDSVKASFIIDTGADHIYIDKNFAEMHGLLSGGKMPMRPTTGVGGKFETFQIFLRSLSVGETRQNDVSVVTIDLRAVVKDTSMGLPDGVLGYAFLKKFRVLLNYPDSSVQMLSTDSTSLLILNEFTMLTSDFTLDRHLILVNVKINEKIDSKMILDTGASYSILFSKFLEDFDLSDLSEIKTFNFGGATIYGNPKFLNKDISLSKDANIKSDIAGILGTSFFNGHILLIDYEHNTLSLLFDLGDRK